MHLQTSWRRSSTRSRARLDMSYWSRRADGRVGRASPGTGQHDLRASPSGSHVRNGHFTGKRAAEGTVATVSPMRVGSIAAVAIVAAVLGGGAALGIGKGAGWLDQGTRTVVVKAQTAAPAALPASATSKVAPIPGKDFDPERIFAERSPGVVTIFAYFGDP